MKFPRKRTLILALLVVVPLSTAAGALYWYNDTQWSGPGFNIIFVKGRPDCWELNNVNGRQLWYHYRPPMTLIEEHPVFWEDIDVYQMRGRIPVAHDQSGQVDVGDIACTTSHSQEWIYRPTGEQVTGYCYTPEWTTCKAAGGTE